MNKILQRVDRPYCTRCNSFLSFLLSWLLHLIQTLLHLLQVTLGYMLMLCVMSYNTWIFLGVIVGSALGYFISFPLLGQV